MSQATDTIREAEDALIAGQVKGGPGSGFFAPEHQGRPGKQGGSTSAGRGAVHRAGITSARPGKTTEQVRAEMEPFKRDLEAVAKDVSVSMGTGGWESGSEDTYITTYRDGPAALSVIAKFAKEQEQDAALVMRAARKGDPGAAPQQSLSFGRPLDRPAMEMIEGQLVSTGIGGWSWAERNGKTSLIVQSVPAWGADSQKDLSAIQGLRDALNGLGVSVTYAQDWTAVTVMESGEYDKWIR